MNGCFAGLAVTGAVGSLAGCSEGFYTKNNSKKPNVLFIICDDLNDWALHPPGHPKAKTPNMDRLRHKSLSFTDAHVAVPVCGPSRKCLFSGLYPQTIKDYGFAAWKSTPLLKGCTPLPLHFRNNGYNAYGTGKLLYEGAGGGHLLKSAIQAYGSARGKVDAPLARLVACDPLSIFGVGGIHETQVNAESQLHRLGPFGAQRYLDVSQRLVPVQLLDHYTPARQNPSQRAPSEFVLRQGGK